MEERPRLRENLQVVLVDDEDNEKMAALVDPSGLVDGQLVFPPPVLFILSLLDGTNGVVDIQYRWAKRFGDVVPTQQIEEILETLDENYYLDSERFRSYVAEMGRAYLAAPYRTSALAGHAYPDQPDELRAMLDDFFTAEDGPGAPRRGSVARPIKGLIAPHIDLHAGAKTYAHAYKALAEAEAPRTFVILGTDHYGQRRFTATAKGYQTPFGPVEPATDLLEAVESRLDFSIREDEHNHLREHSIDFQALWLKYLFPDEDIRIVPVICGSFAEAVYDGVSLAEIEDIAAFCEALRSTLTGWREPVCLLAAADLSHVGMRFGKEEPLTPDDLTRLNVQDKAFVQKLVEMDADGMARIIIDERDERNVCGFPPIYVMLRALRATRGEGLDYGISYEEDTQSCVSFAAVAYY